MSAGDLYGPCPGCGVNVAHDDCPELSRIAIARMEKEDAEVQRRDTPARA